MGVVEQIKREPVCPALISLAAGPRITSKRAELIQVLLLVGHKVPENAVRILSELLKDFQTGNP
jgi:hypothetical protein